MRSALLLISFSTLFFTDSLVLLVSTNTGTGIRDGNTKSEAMEGDVSVFGKIIVVVLEGVLVVVARYCPCSSS